MKRFKKIAVALALVLFLSTTSGLAYAWWDNLETIENDITVPVGEGVTISVNLDEQTEGNLVPEDVVMKTGDVTSVEIDFTVSLDRNDLIEALTLTVVESNVLINESADHISLVNFSFSNPGTIQNDSVQVTVTITLDEPETEAAYNAIANQNITFDLTFTAS